MPANGIAAPWTASRSWTPFALTLGLHLLLVLAWLAGGRADLAPAAAQRAFTFVRVQPVERPRPLPDAAPPPPRPRTRNPAARALPHPVPAPAAAPSSDAPPVNQQPPAPEPGPAPPGELLATSRALAGRADRELRKGSSPITAEPERKWERFADAFAAAATSRSYTVTLEVYEAPDGVTIYRKTVGGRKGCYRSGSVGGLQTGFGVADGRGAGPTPCPTGVSWTPL